MNFKKTTLTNALFISLCIIMSLFIFSQKSKFNSDIYALLSLNLSTEQRAAVSQSTARLSKEFMLLSSDLAFLDEFEKMAIKSKLFSQLQIHLLTNSNLNELSRLKIASFKGFDEIENEKFKDENAFLQGVAKRIFSPFSLLPLSDDFLGLSSHSSLMNAQNFTLDLSTSTLYAEFKGQRYYLARASLKDNFNAGAFLSFLDGLKKAALQSGAVLYAHSGAIFETKARTQGQNEGLYMSLASLCLLGLLSFFAFGKFGALRLVFIVAFSLLGGLCGALICCESLHLMSLVISTSLIGLILDFSLHYMCFKTSIDGTLRHKILLKTFIISLCITTSAYALFLFSRSIFLEQIAVISIFSLLCSFISTYFWLPALIDTSKFAQKPCFKAFFLLSLKSLRLPKAKWLFTALFATFVLLSLWRGGWDFSDDVRSYSALDAKALEQSAKFFEISGLKAGSDMLIAKGGLKGEQKLLKELLDEGLIEGYEGLSKYFLSPAQQQSLKNAIKSLFASEKAVQFFENLGFSQNELKKFAQSYENTPILSQNELLESAFTSELKHFVLSENANLIMLQNPVKNAKFGEIIKANNAEFINLNQSINEGFSQVKMRAITLKIIGLALAFVLMWAFFGAKKAALFTAFIVSCALLCLLIMLAFGVNINIFAIFGLILASAVGVDYCIFAQNAHLHKNERILSIALCAMTSIISFALLSFSQTAAVSSFGLAVSINLALLAFVSSLYAMRKRVF